MLCGQCKKTFMKVICLEVMSNINNRVETGLFDLQKIIQTEDKTDQCPYCNQVVFIILSSEFIVGD